MWIRDNRFPGWEFKVEGNILHGRNIDRGRSGQALLPDSHPKFKNIDLDNRKTFLVDCASLDPELWLS